MQLYPFMRMMNVRARTELELQGGRFDAALTMVREALADLENYFTENYEPTNEDGTPVPPPAEVVSMKDLLEQIDELRRAATAGFATDCVPCAH